MTSMPRLPWFVHPAASLLACGLPLLLPAATASAQGGVQYPLAVAASAEAAGPIYLADRNLPGIWRLVDGKPQIFFQGSKKFRTPLNAVRCLAIEADGSVLAGDSATRQVYRLKADGSQPVPLATPADAATNLGPLGIPMGICVNGQGEIFVSDLEFHCIWKVPAAGGPPQKFAEFQAPIGLACDQDDTIWAVSRVEDPVRRIAADGKVEVIAKGRPFEFPHNLAVDSNGAAYVVDGYKRAIWKVAPDQPPEIWVTHERFVNPVDIKLHGTALLVIDPRAKALFTFQPDKTVEITDLP